MSDTEAGRLQGAFSLTISRAEPFAFIGVRVESMEAAASDLAEISRMLDETMPGQFNEFEKVASKTIKLESGEKALEYGFTFLSDEQKQIREQLTVVPTSKNVYYLGAWTEQKDFGEIEADLKEIAGSFSTKER